jgi:MtN3 and saliva related transmembrane protein
MVYSKTVINIIELIFSSALFINGALFIPQALRLIKQKNSEEMSLITFFGFNLIQIAIILHGIIMQDYLLIIGYAFSLLSCGTVTALIILYRLKTKLT